MAERAADAAKSKSYIVLNRSVKTAIGPEFVQNGPAANSRPDIIGVFYEGKRNGVDLYTILPIEVRSPSNDPARLRKKLENIAEAIIKQEGTTLIRVVGDVYDGSMEPGQFLDALFAKARTTGWGESDNLK
jgi:hypothetical protein